jgi:hypothetical protein
MGIYVKANTQWRSSKFVQMKMLSNPRDNEVEHVQSGSFFEDHSSSFTERHSHSSTQAEGYRPPIYNPKRQADAFLP